MNEREIKWVDPDPNRTMVVLGGLRLKNLKISDAMDGRSEIPDDFRRSCEGFLETYTGSGLPLPPHHVCKKEDIEDSGLLPKQ